MPDNGDKIETKIEFSRAEVVANIGCEINFATITIKNGKWQKDPNHLDKDGKRTRKVRLNCISRNHKNKSFVDFLIKDF